MARTLRGRMNGRLRTPDAETVARQERSPDPLVIRVRNWLAERAAADALMHEWKRLESALFARHGGLTTEEAVRRGHPEGRTMQRLERRCDTLDRRLDRDAARIAKTRAKSAEGALAKIELGFEIQSPFDRDEQAWALVEGGCADLRALLFRSAATKSVVCRKRRPQTE